MRCTSTAVSLASFFLPSVGTRYRLTTLVYVVKVRMVVVALTRSASHRSRYASVVSRPSTGAMPCCASRTIAASFGATSARVFAYTYVRARLPFLYPTLATPTQRPSARW